MKKLAIIGTGISGLSCAHFLKNEYEITIFEKNDYLGGHTNTIDISQNIPVDTGFMVFNETTYPLLIKLFKELEVEYYDTDMSFSVRNSDINLEFNGSSLSGLFSQKRNLLNLKFYKMLKDILTFNKSSIRDLDDLKLNNTGLKDYVNKLGLGEYFFNNFLAPMSSAVWSTPPEKIKDFPASSLIKFFQNHGFVGVDTQLQWKTVKNGSRTYRDKIVNSLPKNTRFLSGVKRVSIQQEKVSILSFDGIQNFDKVIFATHADEALDLIENPPSEIVEVLKNFNYQENIVLVHQDESIMPKIKKNWSSWNFIKRGNESYTVYYMNRLQKLNTKENIFININGENFVDKDKVIKRIVYHHPIFDVNALKAQAQIDDLNKNGPIHFTGSYYRYGFHEDGLLSSVNLCNHLLGKKVL